MSKDEIIKQLCDMAKHPTVTLPRDCDALRAAADLLAQAEQEYKRGYADAMNWKVQNHLEHLPPKEPEQEPVTVLPDGSAFAVMSYPLPKDHWLYAERQYEGDADEPNELGKPILTHALRDAVVSAVRYAIRGATNCGKELDFDPDALVQNAVYALCGPYGLAESKEPEQEPVAWMAERNGKYYAVDETDWGSFPVYTTPPQRKPLTLEQLREHWQVAKVLDMTDAEIDFADYVLITRDVEALHGIKE